MKHFTSGLELFEETWKRSPVRIKRELLKSVGANASFSRTKTVSEMVNRGGGLAANSLLRVHKRYVSSKGGLVSIKDWE